MLILVGSTFAQKKATIHGELVEVSSYVKEGIKPNTPAGKEIALENAKKGGAIALLEKATNRIYILAPSSNYDDFIQTLSAYMGTPSAVKGTVYKRSGITLLVVEDIGKSIK